MQVWIPVVDSAVFFQTTWLALFWSHSLSVLFLVNCPGSMKVWEVEWRSSGQLHSGFLFTSQEHISYYLCQPADSVGHWAGSRCACNPWDLEDCTVALVQLPSQTATDYPVGTAADLEGKMGTVTSAASHPKTNIDQLSENAKYAKRAALGAE